MERAKEFNNLMKKANILLSMIGGFNSSSILEYIDYEYIKQNKIKEKKLIENKVFVLNNDHSTICAKLLGGNLNTMASLIGTKYMSEFNDGDILFIEDSNI